MFPTKRFRKMFPGAFRVYFILVPFLFPDFPRFYPFWACRIHSFTSSNPSNCLSWPLPPQRPPAPAPRPLPAPPSPPQPGAIAFPRHGHGQQHSSLSICHSDSHAMTFLAAATLDAICWWSLRNPIGSWYPDSRSLWDENRKPSTVARSAKNQPCRQFRYSLLKYIQTNITYMSIDIL